MLLQPVILSGGSGTRLWPLSREAYPKQFLPLTSEHTMLQETIRRLDGLDQEHPRRAIGLLEPLVVCNEAHRFLVAEQFRVMGRHPGAIILEPKGRNTAPALTVAALAAIRGGLDPILLVMPADHMIRNKPAFRAAVADGVTLADQGAVVTFGIVPSKPEVGYGYIYPGEPYYSGELYAVEARGVGPLDGLAGHAYRLDAFVEKPDLETAQGYLASGRYLWNSGIFVLKASLWLSLIERLRPDIAQAAAHAYADGRVAGQFFGLDAAAFATCPSDSIDYAVMEHIAGEARIKAPAAIVIPLDAGWSDVGAWSALWEVREQDASGNVLDGDAFVHDANNNLLIARHRMVAVVGVDDLIVVETPDAVLVVKKDRAQDVKVVTQFLEHAGRHEFRHHQRVHRPWGAYESIGQGGRYQVKRLSVKPSESLSLQMHHHRAEHWVVVSGTARVTCDDKSFLITENQSTYIPVGSLHRLENPGTIPLEIIEVQSGSYLGEDDIVRFEDAYERGSKDS